MSGLISSLRIENTATHAIVWIWTRGGMSGQITVGLEDVDALIDRLRPEKVTWVDKVQWIGEPQVRRLETVCDGKPEWKEGA